MRPPGTPQEREFPLSFLQHKDADRQPQSEVDATSRAHVRVVRGTKDTRTCARGESASPLVTSRNNLHPPSWTQYDTPMRELRPYVEKCGTGTLALLLDASRVAFAALTCGSWNCSSCRRVLAAQQLDRMRRGMESRPDWNRVFITLTLDPSKFGAKPAGYALWDAHGNRTDDPARAVRSSILWTPPTAAQFDRAAAAMSEEWTQLNKRLQSKARRADTVRHEYYRVVELHRNIWPHYHVVLEHPEWTAADIQQQVDGWQLGTITQARDMSLDDALGEVAPYLVSTERKAGGHKAYQFAARALPKGFRLHSSSQGFLAPAPEPEPEQRAEHSQPLKGHFRSHHETVNAWGGRLAHRARASATGEPTAQAARWSAGYRSRCGQLLCAAA